MSIRAIAVVLGVGAERAKRLLLTGDLITLHSKVYRPVMAGRGKKKVEFLEPVDLEVHVNPVTLVIGGALGILGAAAASYVLGIEPYLLSQEQKDELQHQLDMLLAQRASIQAQLDERVRTGTCVVSGEKVGPGGPVGPSYDICAEYRQMLADIAADMKSLERQLALPFGIRERPRNPWVGVKVL